MSDQLIVKNLYKKYGSVIALDRLSFSLKEGIYGLLGQNGAGKSTLMNILTTSVRADAGTVVWNDQEILMMGKSYRNLLGYMPQQQNLNADFTVIGFMHYIAALKKIQNAEEKVKELLHAMHLYEHRKKKLVELSGGMRQRLLIAQALLNDPKLLLLDEPTAGLDPVERKNLREIIAEIRKDKIILLATHVISDVEFIADEIIMMKKGKILTVQDQESLMKNTCVYESMEDISVLKKTDDTLKIVNRNFREGNMYTRFISKKNYTHRVNTTLDDVYLDWLE